MSSDPVGSDVDDQTQTRLLADGLRIASPVTSDVEIHATATAVWQAISTPSGLENFHPFVASNPVLRWPGENSEDTVVYRSGLTYRRRFRRWAPGAGYALELGAGARPTAWVVWSIEERQAQAGLTIQVFPLLVTTFSEQKQTAFLETQFGDALQHYLDSVTSGVRHWVETGTPVEPDQFGPSSIYSAAG